MGLYMRNSSPCNYGSEGGECVLDILGCASTRCCAITYTRGGRERILVRKWAVLSYFSAVDLRVGPIERGWWVRVVMGLGLSQPLPRSWLQLGFGGNLAR